MQIVTNAQIPKHSNVILDRLANATKVWVFVAYLGNQGIGDIEAALKAMCSRKVELEIYCGLSQYVSHPEALRRLLIMCGRTRTPNRVPTARLYLCDEMQRQTFHPKMYCFFSDTRLTLLIGSANLTAGGLKNNLEVSAIQEFLLKSDAAQAVAKFRQKLLKTGTVQEADPPMISRYKRKYDIYHRKHDKAEKEAKQEIRQIHELNSAKIEKYLSRYHEAGKDADYRKRKIRYRQARELLDQLADTRRLSKADFIGIYSELVGGGQDSHRWFSTGIARTRGDVAKHYLKVVYLIRLIRTNAAKSPEEVFRIGSERIRTISGVGTNLLTEVMHTFGTDRFAVLNKRPLKSLKEFGYERFPGAASFKPEDYAHFNSIIADFKKWGLESLAQADHFLGFVYGEEKKRWKKQSRLTLD